MTGEGREASALVAMGIVHRAQSGGDGSVRGSCVEGGQEGL